MIPKLCIPLRHSLPHCFPSNFFPRKIQRGYLPMNPFIGFQNVNFHQTKRYFSSSIHPKGNQLNSIHKLGLSVLVGGTFLISLFSYMKRIETVKNPEMNRLSPSPSQIADEKALTRYFELLKQHPHLKQEGDLNDHTLGTYEIIYDPKVIAEIRQEVFDRLYAKTFRELRAQPGTTVGIATQKATELAGEFTRIGVVHEDNFWIWVRDAVIAPSGLRHTYNRHIAKSDLGRIGGAAVLPIIINHGVKKIVLERTFRHATGAWEWEIPRGNSTAGETPADTAKRNMLRETGSIVDIVLPLGTMAPDTGLTASVIPIFLGEVIGEKSAKLDKTEAIQGKHAFTIKEVTEGLKHGYLDAEINGEKVRAHMRDPFLTYALLLAHSNGYL